MLDLVISQQPDKNMSKSLLECDPYIKDQWITAVLTFLSVGTIQANAPQLPSQDSIIDAVATSSTISPLTDAPVEPSNSDIS